MTAIFHSRCLYLPLIASPLRVLVIVAKKFLAAVNYGCLLSRMNFEESKKLDNCERAKNASNNCS